MYAIDYFGMTDYAYKRFTSEKQASLIIGTSRATQGIQPQVVNRFLSNKQFDLPIYNFSFTIGDSPFGEVYFNAIKKKLKKNKNNSLFIIAVDPWSLSLIDEEIYKGIPSREDDNCLNMIRFISIKPNFEYLFRYFHPTIDPSWWSVFVSSPVGHLHDDGWYEVNYKMDAVAVKKNIREKLTVYSQYKVLKSDERLNSLIKILTYLKKYGSVYMCRIPVDEEMFLLEDKVWKDFDVDMSSIANRHSVPYFTFRSDHARFKTIDGNHLYKDDGKIFTAELCKLINKNYRAKQTAQAK